MKRKKHLLETAALCAGLIAVCAAFAFAGEDGPAAGKRGLAVMDLEAAAAFRGEMLAVVDGLTAAYKESQRLPRVVGRDEREMGLSSASHIGRKGGYLARELRKAEVLGVEMAVTGSLRRGRAGYELTLRLSRLPAGETLKETSSVYAMPGQMRSDCGRLALDLLDWQGWRKPAPVARPARKPSPGGARIGVSFGHEAVSDGADVPGGSYFYSEMSALFTPHLGVGLRYSFRLLPDPGSCHLLGIAPRFSFPLNKRDKVWMSFKPGYILAARYRQPPSHLAGLTVVPVCSGETEDILIEFLPFSIYFNLATGKPLFMLEFISLGFSAPAGKRR